MYVMYLTKRSIFKSCDIVPHILEHKVMYWIPFGKRKEVCSSNITYKTKEKNYFRSLIKLRWHAATSLLPLLSVTICAGEVGF